MTTIYALIITTVIYILLFLALRKFMENKTNKTGLLTCPFCGSSKVIIDKRNTYCSIKCECGAQGPVYPIYADEHGIECAESSWNTRN